MKKQIFLQFAKKVYGTINKTINSLPQPFKKSVISLIANIYSLKRSYPVSADIELTNACNLKCPLCPTTNKMKREIGFLSMENFIKIIDQLKGKVKKINFGYAGEMSLNPDMHKMIKYARMHGFEVHVSDNGTSDKTKELIEADPTEIYFALDGTSKATHEEYRRGSNFEDALRHIKELCYWKKKLHSKTKIYLQFIVMKHNEHEIPEIINLAKDLGVDQLDLKPVSLFENILDIDKEEAYNKYIPKNKKYSRYSTDKKEVNKLIICPALRSVLILYNGDVVLCCYDYDGIHKIGNIFEQDFDTIWRSKRNQMFRKMVIKKELELCKKCTMGIGGAVTYKFNKKQG